MSDFIKDLLGELIDDYVTQIEGDIRSNSLKSYVLYYLLFTTCFTISGRLIVPIILPPRLPSLWVAKKALKSPVIVLPTSLSALRLTLRSIVPCFVICQRRGIVPERVKSILLPLNFNSSTFVTPFSIWLLKLDCIFPRSGSGKPSAIFTPLINKSSIVKYCSFSFSTV